MTSNFQVIIFDCDDQAYQEWAENHPNGFVVNTRRGIDPKYVAVHRSSCRLIRQYNRMAKPGGFTERTYIKACSEDIDSLSRWAEQNGGPSGGFTKRCSFCI